MATRYINPYQLFVGSFIPNWLLRRGEISPGSKLCYGRLGQFADKNTGVAWPARETIAQELGISTSQTDRYLDELKQHGLIEIQRRGLKKSNIYRFLRHEWMGISDSADMRTLKSSFKQSLESADMGNKENHMKRTKERIEVTGKPSPDSFPPIVEKTIRRLNELAGTTYRHDIKATVRLIGARLAEGFTEEDLAMVLEHKWNEWGDNKEMAGYFRPETLFGPKHFEGYLQAAKLNGNGHAPVIEELGGDMVKVDGVTMDQKTYELRYARAS